MNITVLWRKSRRCLQSIRQNSYLSTFLLINFLLILIYRKEVYYYAYIWTVSLQPYEHAITFWSSDYHISPIHDLKNLLMPLGVKFFDKSLSHSCARTRTCFSPLLILTQKNGMTPSETTSRQFYDFYRDQIEMNLVDAFVCFHPSAMCELYMPFNRTLIIIASTRYELARYERNQWLKWNENLRQIARDPKNIVAANNLYDAEYIRYFTGIDVIVLPSSCNYTNSFYNPQREEFLLAAIHNQNFDLLFQRLLSNSLNRSTNKPIQVHPIRKLYPNYQYSDLINHRAIIHVPYQVSIMSLFEQYRMAIPLFFPSLDLLTEWHYEHGVVNEKTWDQTLTGVMPGASTIPGVLPNVPDPNNDRDRVSIRYWLNFSDFYQWPHIVYYESTDDLVQKLSSTDFRAISQRMSAYNKQFSKDLLEKWKKILNMTKIHSKKAIFPQ